MLTRHIIQRFFTALGHIEYGQLNLTLPDGTSQTITADKPGAQAQLHLHDWRVLGALIKRGDIGLAETYRDGGWDSSDLSQFFLFGLQNQQVLSAYIHGNALARWAARIAYFFTRNTVRGSQKNIHAHYDLGNEFYALWLDPSMTYSAALFNDTQQPLHQAQLNKYDRILNRLQPSGSLLEIGCGWGGFMERALQRGDYAIKGLTLSKAQHQYAVNRLGSNATVRVEDYRHQSGKYQHIVSIEMFEAVGEQFWPIYFAQLKSLLAAKGTAIVQTITINDAYFEQYRRSGDAIRTFIFPGGMLPSPWRFREESLKAGLHISDVFAFGPDYAVTLRHWLNNFDSKITQVKALGFDTAFIRLWRFYLTYCIAAFQHGHTDVMQWELRHAA